MNRGGAVEPGRLRASDQERDAVAAALAEHVAVGRLSPEEHEERLVDEVFGLGHAAPLPLAAVSWVALFAASEAIGQRNARRAPVTAASGRRARWSTPTR